MQPIASPVSFNTIAHVVSLWKNVRIISRLSSTDLCAGHPARGPTSGSEAYLKSASASDSCQYRSKILSVSVRLYRCFAFYYYVHLPQPVGKDKYTFVHLLKESSYPLLNALPINPIHCITHMLRSLIWISCALSYGARLSFPSMPRCCKNTKNIQKSAYMDGFCLQGEHDLTLFIS